MADITLHLSPADAAIILKADGTFETSLPDLNDSLIPENVIMGAALAYALSNAELCELIRNSFEKYCHSEANNNNKNV